MIAMGEKEREKRKKRKLKILISVCLVQLRIAFLYRLDGDTKKKIVKRIGYNKFEDPFPLGAAMSGKKKDYLGENL